MKESLIQKFYDYKSTRGDKAMKKEAKRKARIEQEEQKNQALILRICTGNYARY